jgi:hypothetical protein
MAVAAVQHRTIANELVIARVVGADPERPYARGVNDMAARYFPFVVGLLANAAALAVLGVSLKRTSATSK